MMTKGERIAPPIDPWVQPKHMPGGRRDRAGHHQPFSLLRQVSSVENTLTQCVRSKTKKSNMKFEYIALCMEENNINIYLIQETWLDRPLE
jgi:hypothetical protein